jgi:hypothetical protein
MLLGEEGRGGGQRLARQHQRLLAAARRGAQLKAGQRRHADAAMQQLGRAAAVRAASLRCMLLLRPTPQLRGGHGVELLLLLLRVRPLHACQPVTLRNAVR